MKRESSRSKPRERQREEPVSIEAEASPHTGEVASLPTGEVEVEVAVVSLVRETQETLRDGDGCPFLINCI